MILNILMILRPNQCDASQKLLFCLKKQNKKKNIMGTGKVQQARMTSTPKKFCFRCFISSLKNRKGTNNTVNLHKSLGLHLIQILSKKVKITFFSCPHTHFKFQL